MIKNIINYSTKHSIIIINIITQKINIMNIDNLKIDNERRFNLCNNEHINREVGWNLSIITIQKLKKIFQSAKRRA